jgi:diguanylate cyclase (GGDEF)-like protein
MAVRPLPRGATAPQLVQAPRRYCKSETVQQGTRGAIVASVTRRLGDVAQLIWHATDVLAVLVDDRQCVVDANEAAEWSMGRTSVELSGLDAPTLIAGPQRAPELRRALRAALRDGARALHEFDLPIAADDALRSIAWSISRVSCNPSLLVCIGIDVTTTRSECQRLRALATTDQLTGLANRAALLDHLTTSSANGASVLFCDLNGFKAVNDALGHAAGDAVLVQVARRLAMNVRGESLVARFGGDEFVIVVAEGPTFDLQALAARLIQATDQPIILPNGRVATVGISIGIATLVPGDNPATVLARADKDMYVMKSRRTTHTSRATEAIAS